MAPFARRYGADAFPISALSQHRRCSALDAHLIPFNIVSCFAAFDRAATAKPSASAAIDPVKRFSLGCSVLRRLSWSPLTRLRQPSLQPIVF
jgi:hypothetical protein